MIRIDPGFQALVPPLSADELAQLEANIIADGCRDPLVVWNGVIVDGHNRYAICTRHGIPFETVEMDFDSREAAEDWMDANQLGRRNLTKDQYTLLLGRRYNRTKKKEGAPAGNKNATKQLDQNEPVVSTAKKLADEYGVSSATVKRAGKYAEAVEKLKDEPVAGKARKDVIKAAELIDKAPEQSRAILSGEKSAADVTSEIKSAELKRKVADNIRNDIGDLKPRVAVSDAVSWLEKQPQADLLLTDPPYSTDVDDIGSFAASWLPLALSKLKPTGRAYICIGAYPAELVAYMSVAMPNQILVWTYRNTLGPQPTHDYVRNLQLILYYRMPEAPRLNCPLLMEQISVLDMNHPARSFDRYHAWQKPMEMGEMFVRHATKPGDTVIDPFACTGTFLLAAGKLGRAASGCDISEENLSIAIERGCIRES